MGPKAFSKICSCDSLFQMLTSVGLSPITANARVEKTKIDELDHALIVVDGQHHKVQPASARGILEILYGVNIEVYKRYAKVVDYFDFLSGPDNFQTRIDHFSDHWTEWDNIMDCMWITGNRDIKPCACRNEHASFERYILEFDAVYDIDNISSAVLVTRKMMALMLGCNKFFGMDGFIYDNMGIQTGEEFMCSNLQLENNPHVAVKFVSQIKRINLL